MTWKFGGNKRTDIMNPTHFSEGEKKNATPVAFIVLTGLKGRLGKEIDNTTKSLLNWLDNLNWHGGNQKGRRREWGEC